MSPVDTAEGQIGAIFKARAREDHATIKTALYRAAMLGEAIVVADTPSDTGGTRDGWFALPTGDGAILSNDSPIAGILELGSRPHWPPLMPILRWVVRKFGLDLAGGRRSIPDNDVENVPWPTYQAAKTVQEGIARNGTKPHRMIGDNLHELTRIAKAETDDALGNGGGDVPF